VRRFRGEKNRNESDHKIFRKKKEGTKEHVCEKEIFIQKRLTHNPTDRRDNPARKRNLALWGVSDPRWKSISRGKQKLVALQGGRRRGKKPPERGTGGVALSILPRGGGRPKKKVALRKGGQGEILH